MADVPPQDLRPPGWYPDPGKGGIVRWWNGQRWTNDTIESSNDWRDWFITSSIALSIDRSIALAAGLAALVAAGVAVLAFLTQRPIPGAELLLIPGVPVLIAGQLWTIAIVNSRVGAGDQSWWSRRMGRKFLFGALPSVAGYALSTAIFAGWLAAVTSFPALTHGNPSAPGPGCPWALSNHGVVTCVSNTTYMETAGAAQRAAAGALTFFFTIHFGVALNELVRRRATERI